MFNEGLIVSLWHRETLQRCFDVCSLLLVLFPGVFVSWCCVNPRGPSVILCMYHYPACVCVCLLLLHATECSTQQKTSPHKVSVSCCYHRHIVSVFLNQFKRWVWVSDEAYKFKGFNKLAYFLVKNNLLMFVNISTYSFWVARLERKKKPSVNDLLTFITDIFITKWVKY